MATSLEFTCIPHEQGECSLLHLPSEMGKYLNFLEDSRFRNIHSNTNYIDHYAVLSSSEALEMVRLYYHKSAVMEKEGEFEGVEVVIASAQLVIAHYYEWESGLD